MQAQVEESVQPLQGRNLHVLMLVVSGSSSGFDLMKRLLDKNQKIIGHGLIELCMEKTRRLCAHFSYVGFTYLVIRRNCFSCIFFY